VTSLLACGGAPAAPELGSAEDADALVPPERVKAEEFFPGCYGSYVPDESGNDGNPCTGSNGVDPNGVIFGNGTPCSADRTMHCWDGQCCPTAKPVCHAEGEQAECADGSTCFEGRCWIACGAVPTACSGTEFPTCATKELGFVSVRVCE
jgi:hypothetical protein